MTNHPVPLKLIWLYWTVAHAAGLGSLAAWGVFYDWFQRSSHTVRKNDIPFLFCVALSILLFVACLQQFILRSAGRQAPWWGLCSTLGLLMGGFLGMAVGDIIRNINPGVTYARIVWPWMFGAMFTCGCVQGAIQCIAIRRSGTQHFAWVIANGLAMFAVGATLLLRVRFRLPPPEGAILLATILGGCYGVISGGALVALLAQERQRHRRSSAAGSE